MESQNAPGAPSRSLILLSEGSLNDNNAFKSHSPFWSSKLVLICVFHLIPMTTLRAGQGSHTGSLGPCSTRHTQGPIYGHRGPEQSTEPSVPSPSAIAICCTAKSLPGMLQNLTSSTTQIQITFYPSRWPEARLCRKYVPLRPRMSPHNQR